MERDNETDGLTSIGKTGGRKQKEVRAVGKMGD